MIGMTFLGVLAISLLIGVQKKRTKGLSWPIKLLFIFFISLPFLEMYLSKLDADKNTKYFNTAATLRCEGGDKNNYLISQTTGWSLNDKYYFLKESLLIRADKCERVGE
jgi:hypothetical protein